MNPLPPQSPQSRFRCEAAPLILGLILLVCTGFFLALSSGTVPVAWHDLVMMVTTHDHSLAKQVVVELRLPRAIAAMAVGGMLSLSGALMQVLLRNPLADPYILGLSGGAACGAILAIIAGVDGSRVEGAALCGALGTMALVFYLSREKDGRWHGTRLLLTGVVVAAGWGAMVSFLLVTAPNASLKGILFWLMGDLNHAQHPTLALLILGVGLLITWPLARPLNLLIRGELQAASLGVRTDLLRMTLFFSASVLTAVAVTTAGSIGFVGLVVPHLIRLLGYRDHRLLLPASVLLGGGLLLLADTGARTLMAPQHMPVGVMTAMIGVPIFLLLLQRGRI